MPHSHSPLTIETYYGRLETDRAAFQPLDRIKLRITGRGGDLRCIIRVCDPLQCAYVEQEVELVNNRGDFIFQAAGRVGVHYIYLYFPGETRWSRYPEFRGDMRKPCADRRPRL